MRKLTLKEFEQRVKEAYPNDNIEALYYTTKAENAACRCLNCGAVHTKKGSCFLDKRKVSICKNCIPTQSNTLKTNYIPPKGYELVEKYTGAHNKILVKHQDCGFIWKVKPHNLDMGKGCPKCSKKFSKGERKIIEYLDEHNINYIFQYPIELEGHNLIMDFYLPKLNKYIEYNGEQHYEPVNFFGGEEKFKMQQFNDSIKIRNLKDSLIVISYLQFNEIEDILKSSTTIS